MVIHGLHAAHAANTSSTLIPGPRLLCPQERVRVLQAENKHLIQANTNLRRQVLAGRPTAQQQLVASGEKVGEGTGTGRGYDPRSSRYPISPLLKRHMGC